MTKNELQKKNDELKEKVYKLRAQVKTLHAELVEISQGIGSKPGWFDETKHEWIVAIKHKAGLAIKSTLA